MLKGTLKGTGDFQKSPVPFDSFQHFIHTSYPQMGDNLEFISSPAYISGRRLHRERPYPIVLRMRRD